MISESITELAAFTGDFGPFPEAGAGLADLLRTRLAAAGFDFTAAPGYRIAGNLRFDGEAWTVGLEIDGGALPQPARRTESAPAAQPHHLLCRAFEFVALTLGVSAPERLIRGFDDWRTASPAALLAALAGQPQRAFEFDPAFPAARLGLARQALAAGRAEAAAALLEGLAVADPAVAAELGLALWTAEQVMAALGLLQAAVVGDPDDAVAAAALAALLARHASPEAADDAIYLASRASELAPDDFRTWAALGDGYRQRGDYRQAGFYYAMALRLAPEARGVLKDAAATWLLADDPASALPLIQKGLALDPDDADHHGNLALAHRAAGRPAQASAALRRALELRPGDSRLEALAADLDSGVAEAKSSPS